MAMPTTSLTKPSTTLDFSKMFSQNSPRDSFTWSDSAYLQGRDVVGEVPPARTQFDALQKFGDQKDKYLLDYAKYHDNYDAFLKSCIDYLDMVKAPIDSPTFTGSPKAPTTGTDDDSTRLATTAFVQAIRAILQAGIDAAQSTADAASSAASSAASAAGTAQNTANSIDGIVASNMGRNGYIKFKSGIIINWGYANMGGDTSVDATLACAFTQSVCMVICSDIRASGDDDAASTGGTVAWQYWDGCPKNKLTFITSGDVYLGVFGYVAIGK